MKEIINSKLFRKIKIIELIEFGKIEVDLNRFAKEWNCSVKSLKMDIEELNQLIDDDYVEFQVIDNKVKIQGFENINYSQIYNLMFSDLIEFRTIEKIFFKQAEDLDDLSEQLFISKASLYRIVNKINEYFDDTTGVKIDTSSLEIVGNETIIRTFFAQYLFEKNGYQRYSNVEDQYKNHEVIFDLIKPILQKLNLSNDYNITYWLFYIIIVGLWRYQHQFTMPYQEVPREKIQYLKDIQVEPCTIIYEGLEIQLSNEAIRDALLIAFPEGFVDNYDDFLSLLQKDNGANRLKEKIIKLKEKLVKITWLSAHNTELILLFVFNISSLGFFNNYYTTFLVPNLEYFDKDLLNERNPIYHQIEQTLYDYYSEIGFIDADLRVKTTFFYMILHWKGLFNLFYQSSSSKKCLLLCEYGDAQARLTKEYLKEEFGNLIEVIEFPDTNINNVVNYLEDIDFIVSNIWSVFPNNIPKDIPIIKISNFPLKHQLDMIAEYLLESRRKVNI